MTVVWTKRALAEIDAVFAFVAAENSALAERLTFEIEARASKLAEHPQMGRPGSVSGTRELVLAGTPYILPYRVRDGRIEILAVFHSSRAWPDQL